MIYVLHGTATSVEAHQLLAELMQRNGGRSDCQLQLPVCQLPAGSAAPEYRAEPQRLLAPAGLSESTSPAPNSQS